MKVKIEVRDNIDALGMFSIINGKVYVKYAKCDFKNVIPLHKENAETLFEVFKAGLKITLERAGITKRYIFRCKICGKEEVEIVYLGKKPPIKNKIIEYRCTNCFLKQ